jgi:uncharacterized protein (TIGR02453 family)
MNLDFALDFLRRLAANNNTAWMADHRADYQQARAAVASLMQEVLNQATPYFPELAGLTPAQVMYRLHKNDRAQRDPEPYKRRMGAGLLPGGRHAPIAGWWLAVQPDGMSWLGAGIFRPEAAALAAIRQEIHYDSVAFHTLRQAPDLLRHFPAGLDTTGPRLMRPPRGYAATDPDLQWLQLKTFTVGRHFSDADVLRADFVTQVLSGMQAAAPLVRFLNQALG